MSNHQQLRIGVIGVGRIGAFHARTLSALPAVAELVIADAVPDLARRVAVHATQVLGIVERLDEDVRAELGEHP